MDLQGLIANALGQAGQRIATGAPTVDRGLRWLARVQAQVFGRWAETARAGETCAVRLGQNGRTVVCGQAAARKCIACGELACLDHALVDANGDLVCRTCVHTVLLKDAVPHVEAPPPPVSAVPAAEQAKRWREALKLLGLRGKPTEEQILKAYKQAAAKAHPDRHPEPRRAAAQKRFIEFGRAKDLLLAELRRAPS